MSCPQIWNIELKKDREKEKVGGRPTKLNEKKGDRAGGLKQEIKNKGYIKKCAARAKLLFLLIRPIVVFQYSPALP